MRLPFSPSRQTRAAITGSRVRLQLPVRHAQRKSDHSARRHLPGLDAACERCLLRLLPRRPSRAITHSSERPPLKPPLVVPQSSLVAAGLNFAPRNAPTSISSLTVSCIAILSCAKHSNLLRPLRALTELHHGPPLCLPQCQVTVITDIPISSHSTLTFWRIT